MIIGNPQEKLEFKSLFFRKKHLMIQLKLKIHILDTVTQRCIRMRVRF